MLARDDAFAVPLRSFGPEQAAAWRDARLRVVSPATVNRELNLLSAVFRVASREWGHANHINPVRQIARPRKTPARKRRTSEAEIAAIRACLSWDGQSKPVTSSQWTAWCHALAVETAMRRGEILGLTPDRVRLDEAVAELLAGEEKDRVGQTKNGEGRMVPLSQQARALFALTQPWVSVVPIVPVAGGTMDALFRRAVKAAGIADLHFHDSRREALTRAAPKLGHALALARMSGHKDPRQLLDYYQPDPADLAKMLDQ
jgi:integrase